MAGNIPWGDWSPNAVTALETHLWPGQYNPGYLCQHTIEMLMQQRDVTVREIRDLDMKKKTAEDELEDIDFTIDSRLEHPLQPFGLKLLPALEKKAPQFGNDIDVRTQFRNKGERDRALAKGKVVVEEKIDDVFRKLRLANKAIQKNPNYKVVAVVNEMVRKAVEHAEEILKMAEKNPSPYPIPYMMAFPGVRPPKKILDKRGYYGWATRKIERYRLAERKGRTNPRCAIDIPPENMKGMPTAKQQEKIEKWSEAWYKEPKDCKVPPTTPPESKAVAPKNLPTTPSTSRESKAVAPKNLPTGSQLDKMEEMYKAETEKLWADVTEGCDSN